MKRPPPLPGPLLPAGEERERPSPSPPSSPVRLFRGERDRVGYRRAQRAHPRNQASVARTRAWNHDSSARRLRGMNKLGEGQRVVGYRKAQRACHAGCRPLRLLVYHAETEPRPTMDQIGASETRRHLPRLLDRVARGESLTITRHGKPVARLDPVTADRDPAKASRCPHHRTPPALQTGALGGLGGCDP